MKKPSLIIHAGAVKTGSSAIQQFLSLNYSYLLSIGILPIDLDESIKTSGFLSNIWSINDYFRDLDAFGVDTNKIISKLTSVMTESGCTTGILSAENILEENKKDILFSHLAEFFDLHLVWYIRPQVDIFLSSWLQWDIKINLSIEEAFDNYINQGRFDWLAIYYNLCSSLKSDRLHCRLYKRDLFPSNDICADFAVFLAQLLPAISSDSGKSFIYPSHAVNETIDPCILGLTNGMGFFCDIHDDRFIQMLISYGLDFWKIDKSMLIIPEKLVNRVICRYSQNNHALASLLGFNPAGMDDCSFSVGDEGNIGRRDKNFYLEICRNLLAILYSEFITTHSNSGRLAK